MTVSLRTKITATTSCIIAVIFLLSGAIYYNIIRNYATDSVYKRALGVTQVGKAMIDGDAFQRIVDLKDKENEEYKEVKNILSTLSHLVDLGEIFAIRINEQNLVYLSNGVKENFLLSYEYIPQEPFKKVLDKLRIGETIYYKDYDEAYTGQKIYGVLLPIINSNQNLVGIIGYKVNKANFYSEFDVVMWMNIVCTVISMLVCILLNYFGFKRLLKPVDKLINTMSNVAKGDYKIEVDIKRKDEIGKMSRSLTKSCQHISQKLGDIHTSNNKLRVIAKKILVRAKKSLVAFEDIAHLNREISLISYEQVDKRREAKLAITYLEEDMRIIVAEVNKKEKGCKICDSEQLIEHMATHINTIKQKLYELDHVFEIIDKHTVNLATVTDGQMALLEEFTTMAEELSQEAEGLNKNVFRHKNTVAP